MQLYYVISNKIKTLYKVFIILLKGGEDLSYNSYTKEEKLKIAYLSHYREKEAEEISSIMGIKIPLSSFRRIVHDNKKFLTETVIKEHQVYFDKVSDTYDPQQYKKENEDDKQPIENNTEPENVKVLENTKKKEDLDEISKTEEEIAATNIGFGIGEINEDIQNYFGKSIIDLYNESVDLEEKRDLLLLYKDFEELFQLPATDNVKLSLKERYIGLRARKFPALRIIKDAMDFTYRRTQDNSHKFFYNSYGNKEQRILAYVIGICKNQMDGKIRRALTDTQKKIMDIFCGILGRDELPAEFEVEVLELVGQYDVLDIIDTIIKTNKIATPEKLFLDLVKENLKNIQE
jgi:hypothetical protein